jgi:competence protein ComFB
MVIRQCSVINANYERVLTVMEKILAERYKDFCACQRCLSDIAAIALNYLPPHYVVEFDGAKELGSPWVMVETAVIEAIDRVIENPNHPKVRPLDAQSSLESTDTITS